MFTNQRIVIREVQDSDQSFIYQGFSNPIVTRYMDITYATLEATSVQMEWYRTNRTNGTGNAWVVEDSDGNCLGVVSVYQIHQLHKRAELGYWFLPEYWGKGYAFESTQQVLNHLRHHLNIHRIAAEVEPENVASKRLLRKLGFVQEAILKEYEWRHEQFADLEIWAKIFPKI